MIRQAQKKDISRIAEILIFTKRMHYWKIFCNDAVSFGEMQVVPLAKELEEDEKQLQEYYVYEDEFVKGLIRLHNEEIVELYVDTFFQGEGIGGKLIEFATKQSRANSLWVLEKNDSAIKFYQSHGFTFSGERQLEEGTTEYIVKMVRNQNTD